MDGGGGGANSNLKEEVMKNLRACLGSASGVLDVRQLQREYKMLMGEDIPYRRLGFSRLDALLLDLPSVVSVSQGKAGELLVSAAPTANIAHIMSMIERQKPAKKRRPLAPRPQRPHSYTNYNNMLRQHSKWRPKAQLVEAARVYPNQGASRAARVSHSQFVSHATPSPTRQPPKTAQAAPTAVTSLKVTIAGGDENRTNTIKRTISFDVPTAAPTAPPVRTGEPCMALKNTKMRLTKIMNSLSMEEPSPNTDITTTTTDNNNELQRNGARPFFAPTGDPVADLEAFAEMHKLSARPVFKIVARTLRKPRKTLYDCKIDVDNSSYTSYPMDFTAEEPAKAFAAKKALDDLILKYGRRRSLLLSNEKDILERIPPMVQKHSNGLWNTQLEADYADKFNEQLPTNWIQVLDSSPNISITHSMDDKYIVLYCEPGDKGLKTIKPLTSDLSIPSNTATFNEENLLTALITCAASASEIWCRQLETPESDAFEAMNKKLEVYYGDRAEGRLATDIKVGGYYVAKLEDVWGRVRVLHVFKSVVNCFFVDYGDECEINSSQIYELVREFALEQAQAFVCRLGALEELYDVSANCECLLQLLGKTVVLELANDDCSKINPEDLSFNVYAYDFDMNAYINEYLIPQICCEAAMPKFQKDTITDVYISHVEDNGDIYVHLKSFGYDKLNSILEDLEKTVAENLTNGYANGHVMITRDNSVNRLYFYKNASEGHWYRVRIIDWAPEEVYCQIYYVDRGSTDVITVRKETLLPLDEINDIIHQIPDQAVKVRMKLDRLLTDFKKKISKLMPVGQKLLLKVLDYDVNSTPVVEFFKRSESDGLLFSITSSLMLESELRSIQNDVNREQSNAKTAKLQKLMSLNKTVPSSGVLKGPALPSSGSYFDVMIPFAVNPWNFCVQPHDTQKQLAKLMRALQERYGNAAYSPLAVDDVQPGHIYASKHVDGLWYRTSVIKVINVDSISAFYCDFGYYANLKLQQLVPLDPCFADLPYQAVKAKLAGIKPVKQKWTMDDCKYFQELVQKRPFVSIIMSVEKDELYQCDTILNLKLVDTSNKDLDVYIDHVLVEKGIAVFDEPPQQIQGGPGS